MILTKLLLAHLLGDFLLQPTQWVKQKEKKKLRSPALYLHSALHALLAWLFVFKLDFWFAASMLFVAHLAIDATKLLAQSKTHKRKWFFIDQGLHLLSLLGIWWWYSDSNAFLNLEILLNNNATWLILTVGFALSLPASFFIKHIIERWAPATDLSIHDSLQNAGRYIGIMERLLVYILVLTGNITAVGFLLAAKSVFRFGDLRQAQDRKLTEYILIGTLLSFGLALFSALAVRATL
jgi:hypothetical protein